MNQHLQIFYRVLSGSFRVCAVLAVTAVCLAALSPDRAWGQEGDVCKDINGQGCGGLSGGRKVCIFYFCFSLPDSGGGGGGGGGGGNGGGGGHVIPGGEGQKPSNYSPKPDFGPNATNVGMGDRQNQISFSRDDDGGATIFYDVNARVCRSQGNSPTRLPSQTQSNTEPVSDDGEFVVQETDVTFPFYDVPFIFERTYRSGVDFQTALGFGWSHSYYQHIIETQATAAGGPQGCQTQHPDVFYQDGRLGRTRFVFDAVNGSIVSYKAPAGVSLKLTKDVSNPQCPGNPDNQCPWTLDDGSGIVLRFDAQWGDLVSIVSPTNHRQDIFWKHIERANFRTGVEWNYEISWEDPNGYVDHVTNSLNQRTVYFVYQVVRGRDQADELLPPWRPLQCLSLKGSDCSSPLVSFVMEAPFVAKEEPYTFGRQTYYRRQFVQSFDLSLVKDAKGNATTYTYEHAYDRTPDGTYKLSRDLGQFCHLMFDDKQQDCRNLDLCGVVRTYQINYACDSPHRYCMSNRWNGDSGDDFDDAARECGLYCGYGCYDRSCWNGNPGPVECKKIYDAWFPPCTAEMTAKAEQVYPLGQTDPPSGCRGDHLAACLDNEGINSENGKYALGHISDLRHNLMTVVDGDGRVVVENTYGTDPFSPDFDKVIKHVQGTGGNATMTMGYHDMEAAGWKSPYLDSFEAIEVCPASGGGGGYAAAKPSVGDLDLGTRAIQVPAYVVVVHDIDIGGAVVPPRTTYFDASWRRLREVREDGGRTDYNYQDGFLKGVQDPAGRRVCYERDGFGRPLEIAELPSPRYQPPGVVTGPVVTRMTYDGAGQAIEAVRDVGGPTPSGVQIIRDPYERVLAVGRAAGSTQTDWQCYQYAPYSLGLVGMVDQVVNSIVDVLAPPPQPPPQNNVELVPPVVENLENFAPPPPPNNVNLLAPPQNGGRLLFLENPVLNFTRSGCARNLWQPPNLPGRTVDVDPSAAIAPDGSVLKQSQFTPSGPQSIIADAYGPDPREVYIQYDLWGRFSEGGRGSLNQPIAGASVQAVYDLNQLVKTGRQDPNSGAWIYTELRYDRSGNVWRQGGPEMSRDIETDELGHTRRIHEYPNADPNGKQDRWTVFNHDIHGRLLEATLPEGGLTRYDYDAAGRLTGVSASARPNDWEQTEGYAYDNGGLLQSSTKNGVTASYTRDGFGRVVAATTAHKLMGRDLNGRVLATSSYFVNGLDGQGRVSWGAVYNDRPPGWAKPNQPGKMMESMTEYFYDAAGRVTLVKGWRFSNGVWDTEHYALTKVAYDSSKDTVTTTDPEGKVSVMQTDALGRMLHQKRAQGSGDEIATDFVYAPGDRVTVSSTLPQANQILQYNTQGALKTVTIGGQVVATRLYDSLGRLAQVESSGLGPHAYHYDAYGLLVSEEQQTDANKISVTGYAHDGMGRLKSVTDGAGKQTGYLYDGMGRLVRETSGLGETTAAYFPGTGRIREMIDPAGTKRAYGYFLDGLLQSVTTTDGALAKPGSVTGRSYDYTALGQMKTATDGHMTVAMTYDSLGRGLSEYNDAQPVGILRRYMPGEVVTSLTRGDPGQGVVLEEEAASYDNLYRMTSLKLNVVNGQRQQQPFLISQRQYQNGLLRAKTYGNKVQEAIVYNGRGMPVSVEASLGGGLVASVTDWLGADQIPRARTRRFAGLPATVDYFETDLSGRVVTENLLQSSRQLPGGEATNQAVQALMDKGTWHRGYTLDGASNWLSRTGTEPLAPGAPDAANRYPTMDGNPVTYDKAGNLTNGIHESYAYNGLGELVVTNNGKGGVAYTYDPLGRRITEDDGVTKNLFIWDGGKMAAYGPGEQDVSKMRVITGARDALIDRLGAGTQSYLHAGTDGSILAVSDANGAFAEGYTYSGFGETTFWDAAGHSSLSPAKGIDNRFLFQGMWFNPATGNYSTVAREYNPRWGRFFSPDPIGLAGGTNLYAFVGGRPLSFSDPFGLCGKKNTSPEPDRISQMPDDWGRPVWDLDDDGHSHGHKIDVREGVRPGPLEALEDINKVPASERARRQVAKALNVALTVAPFLRAPAAAGAFARVAGAEASGEAAVVLKAPTRVGDVYKLAGEPIGAGGEGSVYKLASDPKNVVKIYEGEATAADQVSGLQLWRERALEKGRLDKIFPIETLDAGVDAQGRTFTVHPLITEGELGFPFKDPAHEAEVLALKIELFGPEIRAKQLQFGPLWSSEQAVARIGTGGNFVRLPDGRYIVIDPR